MRRYRSPYIGSCKMSDENHTLGQPFGKETETATTYRFNLRTVRRLFNLLFVILGERLCLILFFLIGLISLLLEYLIYNVGVVPSGFYLVLVEKNWNGFLKHTVNSFLLILAIAFVLSSKQYVSNVFYVSCRRVLTAKLQEFYFTRNKFYYLNNLMSKLTDNPDQRITQDVDKFSNQLSSILPPIIVSPFIIIYYSYICFAATGWIGPVTILIVFIISVIINKFLIRPVMNKVILQEKFEGFFRFKHMHARTFAESIALQDGKESELASSTQHLNNLITTQQSLYLHQFPLDISVNIFNYIGSIVSYLLLARPLFLGKYDALSPADLGALISKNAFVSIYLINSFSKLVDLSSSISQIAGLTYRVSELLDLVVIESFGSTVPDPDYEANADAEFEIKGTTAVELNDVTFGSPSKDSVLVSRLTLKINLGTNLLITGHSSSGKTSLIRVIKGLWWVKEGTIKRYLKFVPSHVFFLPQKALLTEGSLIDQITYPTNHFATPQNFHIHRLQILSYLKYVDLEHVVDKAGGLDVQTDWNWSDILSPGEAQRLSFVRLFYHKPKLAFLDEATSAVATEMEDRLYKKCKELQITVVTIGHRTSLTEHHSVHLHLTGNAGWTISDIEH